MNKQTNIYRNYIFYPLADGRILASMPIADFDMERPPQSWCYTEVDV